MAIKRRVVVVGAGSIGRRHARLLAARGDTAVETVEPSPQALAAVRREAGDLPAHESFETMLATRPDAVWIATPTALHASQTIAALQAGAHVFCEKPMSNRLEDALRMKEAADRAGRILNIGFHLHFCPGLARLKRLVREGELGTVLHAHMHVGTYITLVNSGSRYQAREEGSLFLDYSHQPDLLYWIFGLRPAAIQTTAFRGGDMALSSSPNVAVVNCAYDTPFAGTVHLNYVQMPERHYYEFAGDRGWAFFDFNTRQMLVGLRESGDVRCESFPATKDDMVAAEQQAFFDAMDGARAPETSASDGLVSTAICEAALESWKTGQAVKLPELPS